MTDFLCLRCRLKLAVFLVQGDAVCRDCLDEHRGLTPRVTNSVG